MTKILCNYNNATVKCLDMYTSGMVGAEISFEFSEEWDGLTKTAVFSAGDVQRDVLIGASNVITIPWEVLQRAKEQLIVGVYGTNGMELVIPTVYAGLGRIKTGADPSGDPGIPPTPSILDQVLTAAEQTQENAEAVQAAKESIDASKAHIDEIAVRVIEEAGAVAESVAEAERAANEAQRMAAEASRVASEALEIEGDVLAARDRAEAAADSSETILGEITDIQTGLQAEIDSINEKIPEQASAENQLADKDFVNSSVATNTANYISNENNEPFASLADLQAYSGPLTNNDYAFVIGQDEQGNVTYTRYKYNASSQEWAEEYVLNNSSFTAAQWAAINSGITALGVEQIETNRLAIVGLLADMALKANDADVYHEWALTFDGTKISKDGVQQNFTQIANAIDDKTKFVYIVFLNRLYIPQYRDSSLVSFSCSYLDGNTPTIRRVRMTSTGVITTTVQTFYSKEEIDNSQSAQDVIIAGKADKTEVATLRSATGEIALALASTVKEAEYIKKRMNGILYAEENDAAEALVKTVPNGAMGWAELLQLGGKTVARNQEIDYSRSIADGNAFEIIEQNDQTVKARVTSNSNVANIRFPNVRGNNVKHRYFIGGHIILQSAAQVIFSRGTKGANSFNFGTVQAGNNQLAAIIDITYEAATYTQVGVYVDTTNLAIGSEVIIDGLYCIDLTQWFGGDIAKNINTIEQAYALGIPRDYIPYDEGSIVSADVSSVDVHGVNLWDEQWENGIINELTGRNQDSAVQICAKNYIPIIGGYDYRFVFSFSRLSRVFYYDADFKFIDTVANIGAVPFTLTSPANARYLRFQCSTAYGNAYRGDVSVIQGTSGAYKPYIAPVSLTIPAAVRALDGYGLSAGSVYNEIVKTENGWEYHKRVGSVDLGMLDWSLTTTVGHEIARSSALNPTMKTVGTAQKINAICYDYTTETYNAVYSHSYDKIVSGSGTSLAIFDVSFTRETNIKEALTGKIIIYELATEEVIDITDLVGNALAPFRVEPGGTITFTNEAALPVPSTVQYAIDLEAI